MDNVVNILIGSDNNYAPYYGVLLQSLFYHHPNQSFRIFLMTDARWSDRMTKIYDKMVRKHHSTLVVHIVNEDMLKNCPLNPNHHVNISTYYHLLAPMILPQDVDRILYLDGDMVINGDISALWTMDMTGYGLAACVDSIAYDQDTYRRLDYPASCSYFNNGTSMINLKYWRENNIAEKAFEILATTSLELTLMDQDLENVVLAGKIKLLPIEYNYQVMFLCGYFWKCFPDDFRADVLQKSTMPLVIHYNGEVKPWHFKYWGFPYLRVWNSYYAISPFRGIRQKKPISKHIKFLVKRCLKPSMILRSRDSQFIPEAYSL